MNEPLFGIQVKRLLDSALYLDGAVQNRLEIAKSIALSKQSVYYDTLMSAGGNRAASGMRQDATDSNPLRFSITLSAAILVAAVFAINHWYEYQVTSEIEEIDAKVLTGDLPLDAYLDKGFDTWLKRSYH